MKKYQFDNKMIPSQNPEQIESCLLNNILDFQMIKNDLKRGINQKKALQILFLINTNYNNYFQFAKYLKNPIQFPRELNIQVQKLIKKSKNEQLKYQLILQYSKFLSNILDQQISKQQIEKMCFDKCISSNQKSQRQLRKINKTFLLKCNNKTLNILTQKLSKQEIKYKQKNLIFEQDKKRLMFELKEKNVYLLQIWHCRKYIVQRQFLNLKNDEEQLYEITKCLKIISKISEQMYFDIKKMIKYKFKQEQLPSFQNRYQLINFIDWQTVICFFLMCKQNKIKVQFFPQQTLSKKIESILINRLFQ